MSLDKQALAELGKRAADMHMKHDVPLTEAVVKIAQLTPNLTQHHITRILENANLITFEEKFKGDDKHVVFDLADPHEVNSLLAEESAAPDPIDEEYLHAPSYRARGDVSVFDREGVEKSSSYLDIPYDLLQHREMQTIRSAEQHLSSELNSADARAEHELAKLASMVRHAALQAESRTLPLELMSYAVSDEAVFQKVASVVTAQIPQGVPRGDFSGLSPNTRHPICAQYKVVEDHIKTAAHIRDGLRAIEMKKQAAKSKDDPVARHMLSAGPSDLIALSSMGVGFAGGPLAGATVGASLGLLAQYQKGKALGAGSSGMPPPEPVKGDSNARKFLKRGLRNRYELDRYLEDNPGEAAAAGAVAGALYGTNPLLGAVGHYVGGRAILTHKNRKKG